MPRGGLNWNRRARAGSGTEPMASEGLKSTPRFGNLRDALVRGGQRQYVKPRVSELPFGIRVDDGKIVVSVDRRADRDYWVAVESHDHSRLSDGEIARASSSFLLEYLHWNRAPFVITVSSLSRGTRRVIQESGKQVVHSDGRVESWEAYLQSRRRQR